MGHFVHDIALQQHASKFSRISNRLQGSNLSNSARRPHAHGTKGNLFTTSLQPDSNPLLPTLSIPASPTQVFTWKLALQLQAIELCGDL